MRQTASSPLSTQSSTGRTAAAMLLTGLLALAVHSPSLGHGWTNWDDTAYVANNVQLRSASGLRHIWRPGETPQYYPLTFTTYWIEYQLWGERALGYHATNIVLHAINAVLVIALLRTYGASLALATTVALLFAVAPFQVMSVAWIAERKNLLSTLFGLLSLISLHRVPAGSSRATRMGWYFGALACFALSLLAKSAWAIMPVVGLAATLLLRQWRPLHHGLLLLPFLALGAAAVAITGSIEQTYIAGDVYADVAAMPSLGKRLLLAPAALAHYAGMTLMPFWHAPFHPKWSLDIQARGTWQPLLLLAVAVVIVIACRRYISGLQWWGMVAFVAFLLPVIGLLPFGNLSMTWVSDHFLYYACIGLFAAVASIFTARQRGERSVRSPSTGMVVVVGALVAVMAVQSVRASATWRNEMSLWNRAIADQPSFYPGYVGRAAAHIGRGDYVAAIADYQHALSLNSAQAQVRNDLAWALMQLERYDEAEVELRAALALNPQFARARQNLGVCAERRGDSQAASQAYAEAAAMDPHDDLSIANLATAHLKSGQPEQAERVLSDGLTRLPRSTRLLAVQVSLLIMQNRLAEAEATCRALLDIEPSNAEAHYNLGVVATRRGERDAAVTHYERAIALNDRHAPYWNNLGCALLDLRRPADAAQKLQRAVQLDPDDAPAWNNLGVAMDALGQRSAAIDAFEHAVHVNPRYALAHERLARLLLAERQYGRAVEHLRESVRSVQELTQALAAADLLARTLASAPDAAVRIPTEALELANKLLDVTERSVGEVFDTQSMALAANGRYAEAVAAAEKAVAALTTQGRAHDVEVIRQRLALYQAGQPYIAP